MVLFLAKDVLVDFVGDRHHPVRTAGVANSPGQPWTLGPAGRAMEQFKIKGVKTRLRITDVTPESRAAIKPSANPADDYASYRSLFPQSGVGNWGWVYGVLLGRDARAVGVAQSGRSPDSRPAAARRISSPPRRVGVTAARQRSLGNDRAESGRVRAGERVGHGS